MPGLISEPLFTAEGLLLRRVTCDGVDTANGADERADAASSILVVRGRFAFQDARTRVVASPTTGLFLEEDQSYRITHLDGGDVCVALQGTLCEVLVGSGRTARRISAEGYVRVQALIRALVHERPASRLEIEEVFSAALNPESAGSVRTERGRDHDVVEAIAYRLERDIDARLSLTDLVAPTGVSLFHACRVFRRETGFSIHRYQQEMRLRHALALVLDTNRPLAEVAVEAGFANQGHLTNLFRRRFRTTPARARRAGVPPQAARSTVWRSPSR